MDSHTPPLSKVGFLGVPAGNVTLQPAPALPSGSVWTVSDTPEPLYPWAFYYDRAYSRWVPVARGAVSPDGSHYAYLSFPEQNQGLMNIVDVATGHVRAYPANYTYPIARYVVLDYAKEGIYLGLGYEGPIVGLWLMDPNSGAIRQVAVDLIQDIAGTAAWVGTVNPADPNPAPAGLVLPQTASIVSTLSPAARRPGCTSRGRLSTSSA